MIICCFKSPPTAPPMFVVDPQNITVVVGDLVSLNCSAQATPPPYITWMLIFSNGTMATIVDDDVFNISVSEEEEVTSVLTFIADSAMAGILSFFCEANNNVTESQSNVSVVTIQSKSVGGAVWDKLARARRRAVRQYIPCTSSDYVACRQRESLPA